MARKYNVYGIGNALVDIQYQVDPGFIKEAGIEKGVMTLIDEDRHQALIERLGSVAFQRSSGGSAANTMIGVANMGGKAYYACKVANDEFGDFYLRDLKEADVDSIKSNQTDGITGKCLVLITPDADRTMNTFLGITATFGPEQIEPEVIQQSDYLYIEGYLLTGDSGFKAAQVAQEQAQEKGTRVALTLSDPLVVEVFKSRIQELMDRGVDLLFCNEFEAQALTGTSQTAAACSALEKQVEGFAVTCGPDGAVVRGDGRSLKIPGFRVDAVDTNGAGDMFAGAYLFGLTNGYSIAQSARLATYASSRVVAKYGPRLDVSLKGEVDRILEM